MIYIQSHRTRHDYPGYKPGFQCELLVVARHWVRCRLGAQQMVDSRPFVVGNNSGKKFGPELFEVSDCALSVVRNVDVEMTAERVQKQMILE